MIGDHGGMIVADILRKKGERVVSVTPETPLREAVRIMADSRIGSVVVGTETEPLMGILSERDLVRILSTIEHSSRHIPVGDLCTKHVITCREQNTIEDVMTLMSNNGIRHLPVMRGSRVVAMVSARDLLDAQKETLLSIVQRQKRAYELVLRSKEQAERASRGKTEFLNRMSHELRTPLHAILGFGELAAREARTGGAPAQVESYAGEIITAGTGLLRILNDILDMSRLEIGEWQAADDHLDIGAETAAVIGELAADAKAAGLRLVGKPPAHPVWMVADGPMVRQMLGNLLSNAIKFTPPGGTITVSLEASPEEGIVLSIADTGIGIPAEMIDAVVEPFSQVEDSLTRRSGGTGLGLALVDTMMTLHDGRLTLASIEGQGTVAALRFPYGRIIATPVALASG
jgi:signal transduction histidine kinase